MVTKEPKVEIDTRPPYKNEAKKKTTSAIIDIIQPLTLSFWSRKEGFQKAPSHKVGFIP